MQVSVNFDTNIYFYSVVLLTGIITLVAIVRSLTLNSYHEVMGREYTTSLKGLMALLVLFCHFSARIEHLWFPFKFLRSIGLPAVTVFLFTSGYVEIIQLRSKSDKYYDSFISRKLIRIYLPWFISTILFAVMCKVNSFPEILKGLFLFKTLYRENTYNWFIIFIIFCYLVVFAYGFIYKKRTEHDAKGLLIILFIASAIWLIACVYLRKSNNWYVNSFSFLLGAIFANYKEKTIELCKPKSVLVCSAIGAVALFVIPMVLPNSLRNFVWMLDTIPVLVFVFSLSMHTKMSSRTLAFLGSISLEIFLVGTGVFLLYYSRFPMKSVSIIWIVAIVLVVAKVLSGCTVIISNAISARKNKVKRIENEL